MDDLILLLLVNSNTVPELFTCPKIVISVLQKRCFTVIFANEVTFNNFLNQLQDQVQKYVKEL
jgi:hypothetical protein